MSKQAKRYRLATLPGRVTRDSVEVVEAYDYDALAAQLAKAKREYREDRQHWMAQLAEAQSNYERQLACNKVIRLERDEARAELAATKRLAAMMTKAAADHAETVVALRAENERLIHDIERSQSAAASIATENARLREWLAVAVEVYEALNGPAASPQHWANEAKKALEGGAT